VGCAAYIMDRYDEAFAYRKQVEKPEGDAQELSSAN
jgi:hypothetical protein